MTTSSTSTPDLGEPSAKGLRVLHYTTWKDCGIAAHAAALIKNLDSLGVHSTVRPVDRGRNQVIGPTEFKRDLVKLCEEAQKYDLLHVQHEWGFFAGATSTLNDCLNLSLWFLEQLREHRVPTLVTAHAQASIFGLPPVAGSMLRRQYVKLRNAVLPRWYRRRVERLFPPAGLLRMAVHTESSRGTYIARGVPSEKIAVIPLGVPDVEVGRTANHRLPSAEAKEKLGFPADCILLSLFGYVSSYKGHEVAVRALAALPENYSLAVVGGPHPAADGDPTLEQILTLWGDRDPSRLRITGYVGQEDMDLYHAAADICLTPYTDPAVTSSSAIPWALSSGKPVIASNLPSLREFNKEEECVLLSSRGAPMELAWHIKRLTASPAMRQKLIDAGLRYARRNSWHEVACAHARLYADLASMGSKGGEIGSRARAAA